MKAEGRSESFWVLQTGGWAVFWSAMFLAGLSQWPVAFTLVHKSSLTLFGFLLTTLLRVPYSVLQRRGATLPVIIVFALPLSSAAAAIWMIAHNFVITSYVNIDLARRAFPNTTNTIYYAFVTIAWTTLYFGIHAYLEARDARLLALRLQLNPHFLFNAMNAVSTLVTEGKNDEANVMLSRLSDFLRATLERGKAERIPLADEVAFARQYLDIEKVRFGDRLRVDIAVDDAAKSALVPPMILQPLVENAVRHAVQPSESGSTVTIQATREKDAVTLSVRDRGIGLANTRQRLRELYGSRSTLEMERGDDGMTVSLRIPT